METNDEGRTTQIQGRSGFGQRKRRGLAVIAMGKKLPQSAAINELIVMQVSAGITLEQFETATREMYIAEALRQTDGHIRNAARRLGVHRNTMSRIIEEMAS